LFATHLDWHACAVKTKRENHALAEHGVVSRSELGLEHRERVTDVQTAIHVRERKIGHVVRRTVASRWRINVVRMSGYKVGEADKNDDDELLQKSQNAPFRNRRNRELISKARKTRLITRICSKTNLPTLVVFELRSVEGRFVLQTMAQVASLLGDKRHNDNEQIDNRVTREKTNNNEDK
jgi:hypothetical protein